MIHLRGDFTVPCLRERRLIAHFVRVNDDWTGMQAWRISKRWLDPELEYRRWPTRKWPPFTHGQVQFVAVRRDLEVGNMLAEGIPAKAECLQRVRDYATRHGLSVHMDHIEEDEAIVADQLEGVDVYVYTR